MVHVCSNSTSIKAIDVIDMAFAADLLFKWPSNMMSFAVDVATSNVIAYSNSCEELKVWADMNRIEVIGNEKQNSR